MLTLPIEDTVQARAGFQNRVRTRYIGLTPKGTLASAAAVVSQLIFRQSLASACQTALVGLVGAGAIGLLAELVVAVGSLDLVVGELDR